MVNKALKGVGKAAEKILGEVVGRSSDRGQTSGNKSGKISDLIIDNITDVLGGGIKGKGQGGGGKGQEAAVAEDKVVARDEAVVEVVVVDYRNSLSVRIFLSQNDSATI